jgi:hypothetical protein
VAKLVKHTLNCDKDAQKALATFQGQSPKIDSETTTWHIIAGVEIGEKFFHGEYGYYIV